MARTDDRVRPWSCLAVFASFALVACAGEAPSRTQAPTPSNVASLPPVASVDAAAAAPAVQKLPAPAADAAVSARFDADAGPLRRSGAHALIHTTREAEARPLSAAIAACVTSPGTAYVRLTVSAADGGPKDGRVVERDGDAAATDCITSRAFKERPWHDVEDPVAIEIVVHRP